MALERTVVAVANGSIITFWDKNLRVKLSEVSALTTVWGMEYDFDRNVLWVVHSSGLQKVDFTDASTPVITTTDLTSDMRWSGRTLDKTTGTMYLISQVQAYGTVPVMYKVLADGTLDSSVSLPTMSSMGTVYGYYDSAQVVRLSAVYDTLSGNVIVNYPVALYNETVGVSNTATYLTVTGDLSTQARFYTESLLSMVTYDAGHHIHRRCYNYSYEHSYESVARNMFINKVTGQIDTFFDYTGKAQWKTIVETADPENKTLMVRELSGLGMPSTQQINAIFQDNVTGDYIIQFNDLQVWRLNALFTRAWSLGAVAGTNYTTGLNPITSELYIRNSTNVVMYDPTCNVATQTPVNGQTSATQIEVCAWLGETVPNGASPARILYPYSGTGITDTTPTVVMKVGKNLAGWTQQFRLCADMDEAVLADNVYDYAYERVLDSWANGVSYDATAVWEYSTDYDVASVDPLNGTWAALGTGDGQQVGGIVPANGVDSSTGDVYVRVTLPDTDALTGADANQKWYFKVYSYSRQ